MALDSLDGNIRSNIYAQLLQQDIPFLSSVTTPYVSLWDAMDVEIEFVGGRPSITWADLNPHYVRRYSGDNGGELSDSGTIAKVGVGSTSSGTPEAVINLTSPVVASAGDTVWFRESSDYFAVNTPSLYVVAGTGVTELHVNSYVNVAEAIVFTGFTRRIRLVMALLDDLGDEISGAFYERQPINHFDDYMDTPTSGVGSNLLPIVFAGLPACTVAGWRILNPSYTESPTSFVADSLIEGDFASPISVNRLDTLTIDVGDFEVSVTI